jgi:spectinomycin phosphotransferase
MKEPPTGFVLEDLRAALLEHWGIGARELVYLPVGFGAHHWRAADRSGNAYFLALHDLGAETEAEFDKLTRALQTADWLQTAGELEFVVGPLRNRAGRVVRQYAEAQALAVYPWLECRESELDAPGVGRLLARLHARTGGIPAGLGRVEDFATPRRGDLERALVELDRPWDAGPYGEPARKRLQVAAVPTRELLALYDRLAKEAGGTRSDWVITHGEPYGPNLVETDDGRMLLVDWDSALLAPRERDLWEIPSEARAMRTYVEMTGCVPDPARLRLYRAWYHLAETGIYIHQFREPHTGDLNDAEAWSNFLFHVPSQTNWPELSP